MVRRLNRVNYSEKIKALYGPYSKKGALTTLLSLLENQRKLRKGPKRF